MHVYVAVDPTEMPKEKVTCPLAGFERFGQVSRVQVGADPDHDPSSWQVLVRSPTSS